MDMVSEVLLLTTRIGGYLNSVLNSILSLYMSIFEILITNISKSVAISVLYCFIWKKYV